jgi:hypothetical protein
VVPEVWRKVTLYLGATQRALVEVCRPAGRTPAVVVVFRLFVSVVGHVC